MSYFSPTPTGQTGPAPADPQFTTPNMIRQRVAQMRANRGLPADPASDEIWVRRILAGTHTLGDARTAIENKAANWANGSTPPPPDEPQRPSLDPLTDNQTDLTPTEQRNTVEEIQARYPWIGQLGIDFRQLRDWVADGLSGEAIVQEIRNTEGWKARFAGIRRDDGTLRMNEAAYLQKEDDYRQVLRQFGRDLSEYQDPISLKTFFDNDIDPSELAQRLERWEFLDKTTADIRDSFYVYSGLELSTDDLYRAIVDPNYGSYLSEEYNRRVAESPLDYQTWITRATEVGLNRVVEKLEDLRRFGMVTDQAISAVRNIDPDFARQMMGALYTGGGETPSEPLDLASLERAFEYAMIGGAASAQGLTLPDAERIEAIRQAGIDRARALQGYSQFAQQAGRLSAQAQRVGAAGFDQSDFEEAVFLQQADAQALLDRARRAEEALSFRTTGPSVSRTVTGGIGQQGLSQRF